MIVGAPHWADRGCYYTQVNNPTEEQLRKAGVGGWLETCGPTAAVNCLAALGYDLTVRCPGMYRPQPEEVLADYFNDPRNYPTLAKERNDVVPGSIQGNRVPQYYPHAVNDVFGAHGAFYYIADVDYIVEHLLGGKTIQACLKSPGHYLAFVAYDKGSEELIYHDSWPARVGGDGFARRMSVDAWGAEMQPYLILYWR